MSFLDKARQAANQAAEQARHATEQASLRPTDPATAEKARLAMSQADSSARQAAARRNAASRRWSNGSTRLSSPTS
jgi:hypothetical protein